MTNVFYRDKAFIFGVSIWLITTAAYFGFVFMGFPLSPIAENGLMSLVTMYLPVLLLSVFLLLYLTRKREKVAWSDLYAVNKTTAKKEAWFAVIYLVLTQLMLGFGFNMGLHFPGTDIYASGSHSQTDVWIWAISSYCHLYHCSNYVVAPTRVLAKKTFLFISMETRYLDHSRILGARFFWTNSCGGYRFLWWNFCQSIRERHSMGNFY